MTLQHPVSAPEGYLFNLFSNLGGGGNSFWEWNVHRPASVWGGSGIWISNEWKEGWTGIVDDRCKISFNGLLDIFKRKKKKVGGV